MEPEGISSSVVRYLSFPRATMMSRRGTAYLGVDANIMEGIIERFVPLV